MSRFISFIIIFGGLVGGYFVYQDYSKDIKAKSNHWADDLRVVIQDYIKDAKAAVEDVPGNSTSMAYYRMLDLIYESEKRHYFAGDTVRTAFSGSGLPSGQGKIAIDAVLDNYHLAKQLGVFDDPSNLLRMERGEAPICNAKGWNGEELVAGYVISPLLAPEATYSICNIVLMPKTVRDLQTDDVTGITPEMTKKWLAEHLILPASHEAITAALAAKKL